MEDKPSKGHGKKTFLNLNGVFLLEKKMNQFSGTNQRNEKETRVIIVRHKRQGVKSKRQINKQNRNKSYRERAGQDEVGKGEK